MYITELKNKRLLYWGGYKNTTIPKMLREVFDPNNQGPSGGGYGFQAPIVPQNTHTTYTPPTVTPGNIPLTVTFTNTSIGEDLTYLWNFGDGSTSTALNPTHIYNIAGTYTVKLTVTNVRGSNTKTVTGAITATSTTPPIHFDEEFDFLDPDSFPDSSHGHTEDLDEDMLDEDYGGS